MEKIHLVASSSIEAWSKTIKNILIGGWCNRYLDKAKYKNYNFEIIQSILGNRCEKKNIKIAYNGREQINSLLNYFAIFLNRFHKTEFSQRYWSIILQPWISEFVAFYNAVTQRLEIISGKYRIESATFSYFEDDIYLPNDYNEAKKFLGTESSYFNKLTYEIFKHFHSNDVKINFIKKEEKDSGEKNRSELRDVEKSSFKQKIRDVILKLFDNFPILDNKPFIIGSALPYYEDFLLKISNFQFPKYIRFIKAEKIQISHTQRNQTHDLLDTKCIDNFEQISFLFNLAFRYLPTCYLEGYNLNKKKMKSLNWPENPKYIFTSVNHYFDEIFKFYAAEKVEKGTPYYLGQHGQGFSTHNCFWKHIETVTSDKFLAWGSEKISENSVSLFNLRKPKKNNKNKVSKKGILLITESAEIETQLFSEMYDFQNEKFEFLSSFVETLNNELRNQVTVRLYHDDTNNFCFEEKKWKDFDPAIKLDIRLLPFGKMISQNRVTIFCYDSTGFLETVSQNIPALLYFHKNDFENMLDSEVIEDYQKLKEAKILFNSHKELSDHINNIWEDVNYWWESAITIEAINSFRNKYCATNKNPIITLNKILK
jgi:putative transferase (TIGR04331 family)